MEEVARREEQNVRKKWATYSGYEAPSNPQGRELLCSTPSWCPLHWQPSWRPYPQVREAPQSTDVPLGVWEGHRLPHPQIQTSPHHELHWLRTRNIKPVSCMWSQTQAERQSVELQEMRVHGTSGYCRLGQYA